MDTATFIVTGASGQLGRRVIAHLLDTHHVPAERIVAATRTPASLADLAARGVQVRQADFNDPASLRGAFAGGTRLLLISTDAVGTPGTRIRQHSDAIDAAVGSGVRHIVYTSMPKPEPGSPIPFAPDHYETEQALKKSAVSWTILRNAWYSELLLRALPAAAASGTLFAATGDEGAAYVTREDCARAAAAALASTATTNATYDITGPEAVTSAQLAAMASEIAGKPVAYVGVTPQQLQAGLESAGVPAPFAAVLVAIDVNTKAGNIHDVSEAVQTLTGQPPQSVRDFLRAHAAAFAGQ